MGGDDSQKLLPWRGSAPLRGANLRLNYEINNVTETAGWSLLLTPPSLAGLAVASATGRLGHFWKAHPGQFWRAPKHGSLFSATGRVAGSGVRAGAGGQGHIRGDRMAFRFIHAADIHLDSPLLSLEEYPGAPLEEIRMATRRALAGLVDLAIASAVSFVVIAGDLFDGEWRDCNTGLYFVAEMKRLRAAGIPVYISLGNHDAANRMTEVLSGSFPKGSAGTFNIGVLHTSATGSTGHELYAPCSLEGLLSHQYQYWALGHVHTRAELARDPWIVFSGNIQGRSVRECGPRGCYLVEVNDHGGVTLDFEPLDVVRWEVLRLSASDD